MQTLIEITGMPADVLLFGIAGFMGWALLEIAKRLCKSVPNELRED